MTPDHRLALTSRAAAFLLQVLHELRLNPKETLHTIPDHRLALTGRAAAFCSRSCTSCA